jgi:N-6 DNA Methylase
MNAVEIEEAVSALAMAPFNEADFPFQFLAAFGNKDTTIKRLRAGASNTTDVAGAILQRAHIHLATAPPGEVAEKLKALCDSPKTKAGKVKFILATDGITFEAEDLIEGETATGSFEELADHFGFFLPLAGISTVRQIRDNPFDIRATGRLNKLYLELLKENPEWANEARRHDLNQFMARLIFCFFAEDTGIFWGEQLFTANVEKYSDVTNTNVIIARMFAAMDTKPEERTAKGVTGWVDYFPYVNGGLFGGTKDIPKFSREARTYLLHAGKLNWKQINPDIFGSMIQAVADDGERGELGMHYTSVPNILKVLNPLFLDDVREKLVEAGDNKRKLLALRRRLAAMRVFDPACGSGNFLVIAYIQMREIEAEIIARRGDEKKSWIKLTQFYGIELKDFAAEIARLALLIAEFQSDVRLIGQQEALIDVLPLKNTGLITQGNALRLDWLTICPPVTKTMVEEWDLGGPTGRLALEANGLDGDEVEPETYICGNPPYRGSTWQTEAQKQDLKGVFGTRSQGWKSLDYVAGWLMKAADFGLATPTASAFVSTNSICQGQQVPILWPLIFATGNEIFFAHTSFKWANLASHNAGVTVIVVGLSRTAGKVRRLLSVGDDGVVLAKAADNINAYLVAAGDVVVEKSAKPLTEVSAMNFGNKPVDGGHLLLSSDEVHRLGLTSDQRARFIRRIYGSAEFIRGQERFCLWIEDLYLNEALAIEPIRQRVEGVRRMRLASRDASANEMGKRPHQFREMNIGKQQTIVMPCVSSESRGFLPAGLVDDTATVTNLAFALYDAPLWNMALVASRLHLVWIATVCGKLETRYRYSNTLGWNTFPVPPLSDTQKADLTTCAQDILLAREAHWPATIADLYDPAKMPANLTAAHDRNDQTLERIYIGRRFKNDTERLEKLFELYTKMTAGDVVKKRSGGAK